MELLKEAYDRFKLREFFYDTWVNGRKKVPAYGTPEYDGPAFKITDEQRGAAELYDWLEKPPDKYFLYIDETKYALLLEALKTRLGSPDRFIPDGATTFDGTPLGNVRFGKEFKDNHGSLRVPITVYGNNGVRYYGIYFRGAGSYAKIKRFKAKKQQKTFLDPEESFRGKRTRRGLARFDDGKTRTVWVLSRSNGSSSIPVHTSIRGKYLTGFVKFDEKGELRFHQTKER